MSVWHEGKFEKSRIHRVWHNLTPTHAVNSLVQLDLDQLWTDGKRLILLDVDNTLVQWKQENFAEHTIAWVEKAKGLGFHICIISNTNHVERLMRITKTLGIETVRGRFKPSTAMFRLAMIKFKAKPEQTIMIGDQLMTDVLGANRSGIDAIWVRKMEGNEFGGTKINRMFERFFQSFIYKALVAPIDEQEPTTVEPLAERPIIHQLVRFLIVGISSFAIDYSIRMTLLFAVPYGGGLLSDKVGTWLQSSMPSIFGFADTPGGAFYPVAAAIAASFAILNSFIWNRLWTFEIKGKEQRSKQLQRFVAISLIGLAMNVLFSTFFNHVLGFDDKWNARVATVLAAMIVAIWNFAGQRYYAFRSKPKVG